jgi:arylsulfatase A-like enzyme
MSNMGQWFSERGYECVYSGKWHLWHPHPFEIPGFKVLPTGMNNRGILGDTVTSRVCEGYLRNRTGADPFLLVASFLQPHDICGWVSMHQGAPDELPYPGLADELPGLPANFNYDPHAPFNVKTKQGKMKWTERQWRYYLWSYYRQVEMVDAEIGRVLNALDESGQADNTLIVLTSDHGEGMARHQTVLKNFLYDEAAKVPLLVSWPGHVRKGVRDSGHLVSGVDVISTMCDYAGIAGPPKARGRSLRPLLEGKSCKWREFVAAEVVTTGRMIRTPDYKYVTFTNSAVEQLFDMTNDPGETRNLIDEAKYGSVVADHKKLLEEWESQLEVAPGAGRFVKKT